MQVNSVSFFEHHTVERSSLGSDSRVSAESILRRCVMELEVTNRTEGPLQVKLLSVQLEYGPEHAWYVSSNQLHVPVDLMMAASGPGPSACAITCAQNDASML